MRLERLTGKKVLIALFSTIIVMIVVAFYSKALFVQGTIVAAMLAFGLTHFKRYGIGLGRKS